MKKKAAASETTGTITSVNLGTLAAQEEDVAPESLIFNENNPREIDAEQLKALTKSLHRFGDLGSIVRNIKTNRLIAGHQRIKAMEGFEFKVKITKRFDEPNKQGTVAEGYVECDGERYKYREVSLNKKEETAAMIAANKHGGKWQYDKLRDQLIELDTGDFDMELTGFMEKELEKMMSGFLQIDAAPTTVGEAEAQSLKDPLTKEQMAAMPSHVRMVQLFFNTQTQPEFIKMVTALQGIFNANNLTDTVFLAIKEAHEQHCD